ncbi:MAG: MFS transporter, partial [Rhizobiales bacterium]|nr:MFS transporter [Hyphomicrobiales bacterium]
MDFAVRLSLLYAGIFTAIGVQTPFLPLWLTAKGLDAPMIGALLATGTAARLIAVPLGTRAADGFSSPGIPIMVAAFVAALSVTALAFAGHVATMFALFAALTGAWAVVLPVAESHALRILTLRGRHYGPVRLWGSVSFIAANLGAGWLLTMMAPGELIWTIVAGYWLGTAAAVVVALGDARESHPVQPPPSGPNRIDRRVVLVLAASSLVQASHSQFYGFGSLQWTAAGFSSLQIGMLWAVSVAVEIALFASAARLPAPLRVPQT